MISSGKILAVGKFTGSGKRITRFTGDGALDTSFATTGSKTAAQSASGNDEAFGVAVRPESGTLCVAGYGVDVDTEVLCLTL